MLKYVDNVKITNDGFMKSSAKILKFKRCLGSQY